MKYNKKILFITMLIICFFILFFGLIIGSNLDNPIDILNIILHKIFNIKISDHISKTMISIIWDIRLPRVLLSFFVGAMLSVSGVVIQSILKNPLASAYTIGISSGASLGIGIFVVLGISLGSFSWFIYPIVGFLFSIITAMVVICICKKMDNNMSNNTIILIGMIISLFLNSLLTLITSMNKENLSSMLIWQMGSFSSRGFNYILPVIIFFIIGLIGVLSLCKEMDILTFGDEMCKTVGVNVKSVKTKLLIYSSILTGASISSSGIIGFVDLITPHIARKLFGSKHIIVVPVSILLGGILMVIFDIIARTIIYPAELPISTINALVGTPIFIYIFFKKNRR